MPTHPHRILITGAAGAIGVPVSRALRERGHFVRGFDIKAAPHADESITGDIADPDAVRAAVSGVDTILHLAAQPDDAPFLEKLLRPNVIGLFNVMDAARQEAAALRPSTPGETAPAPPRVILASSGQTVNGRQRGTDRIAATTDALPNNHYGLTKVWAEQMGEMYARCYGMTVLAIRILWFVRNPHEVERMRKHGAIDSFFSHDDAGRYFTRCVEADLPPGSFHVLYAASKPTNRAWYDADSMKRVLGYEPHDTFPQGLPFPV